MRPLDQVTATCFHTTNLPHSSLLPRPSPFSPFFRPSPTRRLDARSLMSPPARMQVAKWQLSSRKLRRTSRRVPTTSSHCAASFLGGNETAGNATPASPAASVSSFHPGKKFHDARLSFSRGALRRADWTRQRWMKAKVSSSFLFTLKFAHGTVVDVSTPTSCCVDLW